MMLYWSAAPGLLRRTASKAWASSRAGKSSGAGRPPANDSTSGRSATLRISRTADGFILACASQVWIFIGGELLPRRDARLFLHRAEDDDGLGPGDAGQRAQLLGEEPVEGAGVLGLTLSR